MAVINLIKKKGINPQTKTTLYFPQWTRRSTDTAMELAAEMDGSTYSQGEVVGVLTDFPKRILRSLMNGNAAKIPGLGTFKLRVQGKAKENIDDVTAQGCRAQVVFDVDPKLAAELADAKFAFVTRPTSEGEQDVVDDETPTDNTNTGDNNGGGEGGGDNNGGGLE
jgi:predicted histone-like DNA-binding protein